MRCILPLAAVSVLLSGCTPFGGGGRSIGGDDDGMIVVSSGAQPRLTCDARLHGRTLRVAVTVAAFDADSRDVSPTVGLSAIRTRILHPAEASVTRGDHVARYVWSVSGRDLVDRPDEWRQLRMGIDVRWAGGPRGTDRRHERYRHIDAREPSAGLSPRPMDWAPLDLEEWARQVADRRDELAVTVSQPMDGKLSVVIEDEAGHRIRNLVSGISAAKGSRRIVWDGCDEDGRLVKEGAYRWRSISHPGIVPDFAMNFCNADKPGFLPLLSNHCHFLAAGANGEWVVLAAVGTEGGYSLAAFDRNGIWQKGFNSILGTGWNAVAVALDDRYLYAAHDGEGWGMSIDKTKPDWTTPVALTLTRFDLKTGEVVDYAGGRRWSELERHPWGPGTAVPALREAMSLSGMALLDGKLYVGSRAADALLVVDPATGQTLGAIPFPKPGSLAAGNGRLVGVSDGHLLAVDPATHAVSPYLTESQERDLDIRAVALDAKGRCYLADGRRQTVRLVDADGKITELGKPGGTYAGPWQEERMVAPSGLAVLGDWLWVAEDRSLPKRAVAWDLATRRVIRQVFGNPAYGGPAAGFDPKDSSSWIGEGAWWKLDVTNRTAQCVGILGWTRTLPMHWRVIRQEGRTYLVGMGMANILALLRDDGTVKPVAAWASAHAFSFANDWHPPKEYIEAFNAAYPAQSFKDGQWGRPGHGPGMLWVDRNGDGVMQREEFEFSGSANVAGGSWGHDIHDLTLRLPGDADGKPILVAIRPDGVDSNGVPRYPRLIDAVSSAVKLVDPPRFENLFRTVSSVTRAGNLVVLGNPMTCWTPEGRLCWRYPNAWYDVHGSHGAPLPAPGVMQGSLFILGMAPLDATNDVFVVNGNHGRFFVVTSDGIYLDEMFNDCRVAQTRDAMLIGGECFGGVFGRSEDGTYWLQTGGDGFRVYRVEGLDQLRRNQGKITVGARQLLAAQRRQERRQAETPTARTATLARLAQRPVCDGNGAGWPSGAAITWAQRGQNEGRVEARLGVDTNALYLSYTVFSDASPWVNNGKDWTLLFKTGDSIDLQLGTDSSADPVRKSPVPGDLRLLIAPMGTQNVAVVYRHRVPGMKQGMVFSSPWRSETVDGVKRLDHVKIGVARASSIYRVEAVIPLADLEWIPKPGATWKADLGVIYGDDAGTINLLRSYWANQATGLVNDVPGEIMLNPDRWGTLRME